MASGTKSLSLRIVIPGDSNITVRSINVTITADTASDKVTVACSCVDANSNHPDPVLSISHGGTTHSYTVSANSSDTHTFTLDMSGGVVFSASSSETVRINEGSNAYPYTSLSVSLPVDNTEPSVYLSVPTLYAGTTAKITWTTRDDDGDTVTTTSLVRHYKASGASSYDSTPLSVDGNSRSYTDTIPESYGNGLIYYTVSVSDGEKTASSSSSAKTVISNRAPTISGSNGELGEFALTAPTYSYSVSDPDGGTVTVKEEIDGVIHREFTATLGEQYTLSFGETQWMTTLNGTHTITITATDSKNATATRTLTFTKNVTSFSFMLETPLDADDMITKCSESLTASIPSDAYILIEVCNNGYDDEPTWEDVTESVLNRRKIYLTNTKKTADKWGYNIRVTVNRLESTLECWAFSMIGHFE